VEVIQIGDSPMGGGEFRVGPREPLPENRTYDLIVDGLLDAKSRRPLPYLKVFPAGVTAPRKIEWVGAFNHPLAEPEIDIKFNDDIDPSVTEPQQDSASWYSDEGKLLLPGEFAAWCSFWQLAPGEWELQATGRAGAVKEKITVQ
jgi:hypothetical protein